jgi:hypothetical protein
MIQAPFYRELCQEIPLRSIAGVEILKEPSPRVRPVPVGRPHGNSDGGCGFFHRQTRVIPQVNDSGHERIFRRQLFQCCVESEKVIGPLVGRDIEWIHFDAAHSTAPLGAKFSPSLIDEDSPHGFGGGGEKVPAIGKLPIADQPQIGFVNECRGIERLPRFFGIKMLGRESAQLAVNQRQQLRRGLRVAGFNRIQNLGNIAHARSGYRIAKRAAGVTIADDEGWVNNQPVGWAVASLRAKAHRYAQTAGRSKLASELQQQVSKHGPGTKARRPALTNVIGYLKPRLKMMRYRK